MTVTNEAAFFWVQLRWLLNPPVVIAGVELKISLKFVNKNICELLEYLTLNEWFKFVSMNSGTGKPANVLFIMLSPFNFRY